MAVDAALARAVGRTAEVHPAVDAIDLEIEGPPVGPHLLAVAAPAIDEPVRAGRQPFVLAHVLKICPRSTSGNGAYGLR